MDCAEEVLLLRRQLGARTGVRDLQFDILHARMTVEYDPQLIQPPDIETAVPATGMDRSLASWLGDLSHGAA